MVDVLEIPLTASDLGATEGCELTGEPISLVCRLSELDGEG